MGAEIEYVPPGKYIIAGVFVVASQEPGAQRSPAVITWFIALVSSVMPSLGDRQIVAHWILQTTYPLAP